MARNTLVPAGHVLTPPIRRAGRAALGLPVPILAAAALLAPLTTAAAVPTGASADCVIEGETATPADLRLADAACERARSRFGALLGGDAPPVLVLLEDRPGYRIGMLDGHAVILWPTGEALERGVSGPVDAVAAHIASQWRDVLPHEIGHALTAAFFFPDGRFRSTGYGTPLPDWFEEAVAIWMEPTPSREGRLASARRLPEHRLDLVGILTMRHPAAGDAEVLEVRDGAAPPDDAALWDFYPQALAVLAFIYGHGGPAAVRQFAFRLMADPTDPAAIVGLRGLPDRLPEVEAAWVRWLGTEPATR